MPAAKGVACSKRQGLPGVWLVPLLRGSGRLTLDTVYCYDDEGQQCRLLEHLHSTCDMHGMLCVL